MLDENSKIGFYLVGDPSRCSCSKVIKNVFTLVNMEVIPAVKVSDSIRAMFYSDSDFRARVGRDALQGEIGCALAHQNAYSKVIENQFEWSFIFEDDAHLEKSDELEVLINIIKSWRLSRPVAVSFYTDDLVVRKSFSTNAKYMKKTPIPPPNTVAYVLNKQAAKILKDKNRVINNLADWPATAKEIDFYLFSDSGVTHGCVNSSSTIIYSGSFRPTPSLSVKLQIWTGIWFLRYRSKWSSYSDFYYGALEPRIRYKIEQVRQRFSN